MPLRRHRERSHATGAVHHQRIRQFQVPPTWPVRHAWRTPCSCILKAVQHGPRLGPDVEPQHDGERCQVDAREQVLPRPHAAAAGHPAQGREGVEEPCGVHQRPCVALQRPVVPLALAQARRLSRSLPGCELDFKPIASSCRMNSCPRYLPAPAVPLALAKAHDL